MMQNVKFLDLILEVYSNCKPQNLKIFLASLLVTSKRRPTGLAISYVEVEVLFQPIVPALHKSISENSNNTT